MAAADYPVRWTGSHAVVTMPTEIDIANADEVRQALVSASGRGDTVLVIDMSGTTFCDSAGVHAIIAAWKQAEITRTQVRLVATTVLRVFELIGADQLIPIYPTLEAAIAGTPPPSPRKPSG